jgi:hypothetical protein
VRTGRCGVCEKPPVARRDLPGWVLGTELMQRHPAAPLLAGRPRRPADRRTGERGCPDRPAHGAIRLDHLTPTTGQAASSHRPRSATGTVTTPAGNHRADRGSFPPLFQRTFPTDQHQHHPGKRRHAPPAPPETPRTALGTPPADSLPLSHHRAHLPSVDRAGLGEAGRWHLAGPLNRPDSGVVVPVCLAGVICLAAAQRVGTASARG